MTFTNYTNDPHIPRNQISVKILSDLGKYCNKNVKSVSVIQTCVQCIKEFVYVINRQIMILVTKNELRFNRHHDHNHKPFWRTFQIWIPCFEVQYKIKR